jgi:hypothetical protein
MHLLRVRQWPLPQRTRHMGLNERRKVKEPQAMQLSFADGIESL